MATSSDYVQDKHLFSGGKDHWVDFDVPGTLKLNLRRPTSITVTRLIYLQKMAGQTVGMLLCVKKSVYTCHGCGNDEKNVS